VGLCSYLLIGFWYRDPANGRAAQKAFIVTRVGDVALALGLFLLFQWHGTLEIAPLLERATATWAVGSGVAIAAAALLLGGAVGKSAQLPLQVWLPDAMAGPTPVSALIHAATMVTAGVYLIARTHPLFELAPPVMTATAAIGAATLLLAGASALVQRDLKRVLAWSTISQLGYMFLALGVGAWSAAIFHLVTHACFKALLFLGAGAVLLGLHHEQDLRRMGGLRRVLPVTFATFVVGSAALAGVPLVTAGFYSKDLILWRAWGAGDAGPWLWVVGLLGAGLTALYVFRAVFLAFAGRARWTPDAAHGVPHHPGWRVHVPLVALAVLSVVTGFLETPAVLGGVTWFSDALAPVLGPAHGAVAAGGGPIDAAAAPHDLGLELALLAATAVVALGGIALAWRAYRRGDPAEARAPGLPAGTERFLRDGWGFDAAYDRLLVRPFARLSRANAADAVDLWARGVARLADALHAGLRRTQTGSLRWYAGALLAGAALFVAAALIGGWR
jgi:NADH-quinone oxidoreductase subunit L